MFVVVVVVVVSVVAMVVAIGIIVFGHSCDDILCYGGCYLGGKVIKRYVVVVSVVFL